MDYRTAPAQESPGDPAVAPPLWSRRNALPLALIAVGAGLRLWQYASDTSFWFDELSIARNLRERSLADLLLHPLGYDQVVPVGFIALEKLDSYLLGSRELALRLPLFLIGLLTLVLFWPTAARVLKGAAVPIAVALFAIGCPLVRYSSELKQYGTEIATTLLLTTLALDLRSRTPSTRQCLVAGLVGFISVWFSQAAVLVLAGLGAALTTCWILDRNARSRRPVTITVPIWAFAALLGLISAMRHTTPATMTFMHAFWLSRRGFMPLPISVKADANWLWFVLSQFFADKAMLHYPFSALYTVLMLAGFGVLFQQRRDAALILLGPLVVTLAASMAQQFPLRLRVALFVIPTFVIALAAGIDWLRLQLTRLQPALGAAAAVALLAPPAYAIATIPPPYFYEAFKPVLAYVQAHHRVGDAVYVYANAYEAIDYYGPRFGLPPGSYVVGICDEREVRPYLADVDRFRGLPRLWVFGAAVPDFHHPRSELKRYLETIGVRRDSIAVSSPITALDPVGADLYDLSDSTRLRSAASSTFTILPFPTPLRPLCHDWIRPTLETRSQRPETRRTAGVVRSSLFWPLAAGL